jgi:hypothetical protein
MLEAARGPVPNLVAAIAGKQQRGSWWTHPRGREIFAITRAVRDSPNVLVCRLASGRITYVHRRVWPALVRLAPRLPSTAIARLREVHTATGKHRVVSVAYPRWVPAEVRRKAAKLSERDAVRALGDWIGVHLSRWDEH